MAEERSAEPVAERAAPDEDFLGGEGEGEGEGGLSP